MQNLDGINGNPVQFCRRHLEFGAAEGLVFRQAPWVRDVRRDSRDEVNVGDRYAWFGC